MTLSEVSFSGAEGRFLAKRVLLAALIGGVVALALEPDHTSDLPIFAAYGLWATHILAAAGLFLGGIWVVRRMGAGPVVAAIISAVSLPALFAPVSLLLDYGFGNPDEELQSSSSAIAIYLSEMAAVAPVALAVALVVAFLLRRDGADREDGAQPVRSSLRSLIGSVPGGLGDDVIRLHAQDHYVEIVTAKGSALLTEQFGDCMQKLSQLDGIQCHRSHWISLAHVETLKRAGSAYACTLSNGDEVPVSRRRYGELKDRMGSAGA